MTDPILLRVVQRQPYPLLFVTISGAHLYGFPSADSDVDLRGVHLLPTQEVLGLGPLRETIEESGAEEGRELDIVTHDAGKFFRLLLRPNGYVLEQLHSPLVVYSTPEHAELRMIARHCITRFHARHYLGFAETQWRLVEKQPRVKPLLYMYRVLMTGIRMMRTGEVEANLPALNQEFALSHVDDLLARKTAGAEKDELKSVDMEFHHAEVTRLRELLVRESERTHLPEHPLSQAALNELLVRIRTRTAAAPAS
ncbi:MAG: nucleotidyltransferase domain-containing protein [Phycisphaerales bacterium]|nr:nucleotidyltransferase domain-containing protein [Phycisphaerales bacterium]